MCYIIKAYILVFILLILAVNSGQSREYFKVMFYNVENLFDCVDDPDTNDDEFTPKGAKYWTNKRFTAKCNNIASVIDSASRGHFHDIIGLCEIENSYVLHQLVTETSLKTSNYKIIHKDSPDERGIDVALLYKETFTPLHSEFHTISDSFKTREILYVRGKTIQNDTLHIFVNHWPSKLGGIAKTLSKRILAAQKLKSLTDSIFSKVSKPNICIMGDFNDFADSESVDSLHTISNFDSINSKALYNMCLHLHRRNSGTSVYKNKWQIADLFFVSGNLLDSSNSIHTKREDVHIFREDFLLEQRADKGFRPFRSFMGPIYKGGYSDHLPLEIIFEM